MVNLLDEIDGRLFRMQLGYPSASLELLKIQKHIRYALQNPNEVNLPEYVERARGQMTAMMVRYPDFVEHFKPIVDKINQAGKELLESRGNGQ